MLRSGAIGTAVALAILVASACGGDGGGDSHPPRSSDSAVPEVQHNPDLSAVDLSADDRSSLRSSTVLQAEVAADETMTFDEYEAVVLEGVACYAAEGYEVRYGLRLTAYGYYYLEFVPRVAGEGGEKEHCATALQPTLSIWSKAKTETVPQAVFAAAHDTLWNCLAEREVSLRGRPPGAEAAAAIIASAEPGALESIRVCQERVFLEWGLPNWIG